MQIQINTDHNIEAHEALITQVSNLVENTLSRLDEHITRVEVHLSDENGSKNHPNDKRCIIEARLKGRQPVAVTNEASDLIDAVEGAAEKLVRMLESTLGKLQEHNNHSKNTESHSL